MARSHYWCVTPLTHLCWIPWDQRAHFYTTVTFPPSHWKHAKINYLLHKLIPLNKYCKIFCFVSFCGSHAVCAPPLYSKSRWDLWRPVCLLVFNIVFQRDINKPVLCQCSMHPKNCLCLAGLTQNSSNRKLSKRGKHFFLKANKSCR